MTDHQAQNADVRRKPQTLSLSLSDSPPSPGHSSTWRETAESHRFSQETTDWGPTAILKMRMQRDFLAIFSRSL